MLNSRDINLLREDVAWACGEFIRLCKDRGLNTLITSTVRDEEYQAYLYAQGRTRAGQIVTNAKVPSFHSDKAGLAFDFCKNVPGHEYDDGDFFYQCAKIGKSLGLEWGGDWKNFTDKPHLQWSGEEHEFTSADIIAGRYPGLMPSYVAAVKSRKPDEKGADSPFDAALLKLVSRGVIDSPEYWKSAARVVKNLDLLIEKFARSL